MAEIIVAHRGGKEYFHENTLKAFEKAIQLGAPYAELDIWQTKDKKIVCFHDSEVQNQKITDITYKELLDLSGIDVPLFEAVLKLTKGKLKLLCEIKAKGFEKEAVNLLTTHFNLPDAVIISYIDNVLYKVSKINPTINTGLIIGKKHLLTFLKDLLAFFRMYKCKAKFLISNFSFIKLGFAKIAKLLNLKVFTWTVDEPEETVKYIKNKNIYGVITNKPEQALKLLSACSNGK